MLRNPYLMNWTIAFCGRNVYPICCDETNINKRGAWMTANDCLNVVPEAPDWGAVAVAMQSDDSRAMRCQCGSFSFHLVRVDEDESFNVMCAGCLLIVNKG